MPDHSHMVIDPSNLSPGNANATGVTIAGDGLLRHSSDGGQTWTDYVTAIGDPPNDAGDSTAPTASDVVFNRLAYDPFTGDLYGQGEWYNTTEAEWRSWLFKRTTAGVYTWISGVGAADFAPQFNELSSTEMGSGDLTLDGNSRTLSSTYITGGTNRHYIEFSSDGVFNGSDCGALTADDHFGVTIHSVTPVVTDPPQNYSWLFGQDCPNETQVFSQYGADPDPVYETEYEIARFSIAHPSSSFTISLTLTALSASTDSSRQLGITVDNYAGSTLYTTEWDSSNLLLVKRSTSDLTLDRQLTLGGATATQIDNRNYFARPYSLAAPLGSSDTVYVYGRWQSGATTYHITKSTDGGATLGSSIGGSWGTGWVSEMFAISENTIYAFVAGSSRALYKTDDAGASWTNLGTLPFDVDSASLSANGVLCIVNRASGSQQIAMSEAPFTTWTDATVSPVDTTGGKVGVRWV